jgi:phosphoribosylaminoimidazole carboxylase PurE protein
MSSAQPLVGVVMGSDSDWPTMQAAAVMLKEFGVAFEARVVSAHRTPDLLFEYAGAAAERGLKAIIAGAGGAAHLPGMLAAKTLVPVLGVPVQSKALSGQDSLLSIVQMPKGIPVATFAIGEAGAANAALFRGRHPGHRRCGAGAAPRRFPPGTGRESDGDEVAGGVSDFPQQRMILPPATLGMLGGGQLGRFFVTAAHEMGYPVWVLDPDPHSPAALIADRHLIAAYDDFPALDELADGCAAITTEFENVPAGTLDYLDKFVVVRPSAAAVSVCQNRIAEKDFLRDHALPHAAFAAVHDEADLRDADERLFPGILKVARFGYDGKGQAVVAHREQAIAAFQHFKGETCVLEQKLELDYEVSVVLARDETGRVTSFPLAENTHRKGILDVSLVPARATSALRAGRRTGRENRRSAGLHRHPGSRVLRRRGPADDQRNGPPAAQQRPLHDRRLHHQPVRAAGARPLRPAARRGARALGSGDGQPARRPVVRDRRHRPALPRAGLVEALRLSRPQAAPLRQASRPPRAQDGTLHRRRWRPRTCPAARAGGARGDRHLRRPVEAVNRSPLPPSEVTHSRLGGDDGRTAPEQCLPARR